MRDLADGAGPVHLTAHLPHAVDVVDAVEASRLMLTMLDSR